MSIRKDLEEMGDKDVAAFTAKLTPNIDPKICIGIKVPRLREYAKQISKTNNVDYSTAYDITIGYPTSQIIKDFNVDNDETYSLYYDWQNYLSKDEYSERLDTATGE